MQTADFVWVFRIKQFWDARILGGLWKHSSYIWAAFGKCNFTTHGLSVFGNGQLPTWCCCMTCMCQRPLSWIAAKRMTYRALLYKSWKKLQQRHTTGETSKRKGLKCVRMDCLRYSVVNNSGIIIFISMDPKEQENNNDKNHFSLNSYHFVQNGFNGLYLINFKKKNKRFYHWDMFSSLLPSVAPWGT